MTMAEGADTIDTGQLGIDGKKHNRRKLRQNDRKQK
jgi:hypothetical protein